MKHISAGDLRHHVTIESEVQTQDPVTGAINVTWQTFAQPWAQIAPLSGRETMLAQQLLSKVDTRITIRFRAGVLPSMRVRRSDGRIYNIEAVIEDMESGREYLQLQCSSGVNDG